MTDEIRKAVVTLFEEPGYKTLNLLIRYSRILSDFCDEENIHSAKDMADILYIFSESEKKAGTVEAPAEKEKG